MRTPSLDLLRETRLAQGQAEPGEQAASRRALLIRGALLGLALVAAAALITAPLLLRQRQQRAELALLAVDEAELETAETRLRAARGRVAAIRAANRTLVQGLAEVRSGSALLTDLQRRVPQGVQLTGIDLASGSTSLRLQGQASDPQAFAHINALQIELARSPLFQPAGVKLIKAVRSAGVGFELLVQFRAPAPPLAARLQLLQQLGADGMALRLQQLQGRGLL